MFSKASLSSGLFWRIAHPLRPRLFYKERIERRESMLEFLRRKGVIILSDTSAVGGFDAVAMYGSLTAGVLDARGRKEISISAQRDLLQRSIGMGFSSLIFLHDGNFYPTISGVIYWSCVSEEVPKKNYPKILDQQYYYQEIDYK